MTKAELRAIISHLQDDNMRCAHRVGKLETAIQEFLDAEQAGEMGNLDKALAHLRHLMAQI